MFLFVLFSEIAKTKAAIRKIGFILRNTFFFLRSKNWLHDENHKLVSKIAALKTKEKVWSQDKVEKHLLTSLNNQIYFLCSSVNLLTLKLFSCKTGKIKPNQYLIIYYLTI